MIRAYRGVVPKIAASAYIDQSAQVIGDVAVGERSSIWPNVTARGDVNYIRIGDETSIQDNSVLHVTRELGVTLEDEVSVGHQATVHACYVERGALIGIGAIVLDGARIGAQSLIAAGALVTPRTVVPPRSLVMGSPAKVKRELNAEELALLEARWRGYVELAKEYKNSG